MIGDEHLTVRELYASVKDALERGGIENAGFEAEQLLRGAGIDKITLISEPNRDVSDISAEIRSMTERRLSGEPLQYILGEWEFYGLPFKVGEGVLIPRQDTETLVDVGLNFLNGREQNKRRTLDLCAGSGCIGLTIAKLAGAEVTLVEKSEQAFGYLWENILLNGVSACGAVRGDVLNENTVCDKYDLIVSNPPYLTDRDMQKLQKEVEFEPKDALYGGADGLDFYRSILGIYPKKLKRGGMIAVEIGMGQESAVSEIFRENGIEPRLEKDMCGVYRVVYGVKR